MNPRIENSTTEQFLDEAFDLAIDRLERGFSLSAEELADGREDLLDEIARLVRLAESIAVGQTTAAPMIAGYSILSELGVGGMGTVYLAQQQRLGGRPVALKVLPASVGLSPRARQRFLREAHAIAKLRHPNVIAIHDVIEDGRALAYAMEYVEGKSLADLVEHLNGLEHESTIRDVCEYLECDESDIRDSSLATFFCRLGIEVAGALGAVHATGLIHRDVKPSNILLRRDGTPLLSDFGLVRETDSTMHTQAGQFVGTAAYSAPEQLRGQHENVDERSDVYALGVTLYHSLAGRLPFNARSPAEILQQVEAGKTRSLRRGNSKLPRDLETIVSKATDPNPRQRYQSAADLADDLQRALSLQPIRARAAGPITRGIKFARRNRRTLTGVVAGAALVLVLTVLAAVYLLVVPIRRESHLQGARLSLLDPQQGDRMLATIFWGERPSEPQVPLEAVREALRAYDRAVKWAPFGREIRLERETVKLAERLATDPTTALQSTDELRAHAPITFSYWEQWAENSMPLGVEETTLESAAATDLRLLGLLAFLCRDMTLANEAWTRLDLVRLPDPFIEASLGQLYLVTEQYPRAYPHLLSAFRTFDDVGFLCVDLADAAVQVGYLDEARRLLDRANSLENRDPFFTITRVEADYYAAIGEDDKAIERYEFFRRKRQTPIARDHYGQFLIDRHQLREAIDVYAELVQRRPRVLPYRTRFIAAADMWWESLSVADRRLHMRRSLDGVRDFVDLLRLYVESTEMLKATEPDPAVDTSVVGPRPASKPMAVTGRAGAVHSFCADSAALWRPFSAPFLQDAMLFDVAERMEISDMTLLYRARMYPNLLKRLQVAAWLSPTHVRATAAVAAVALLLAVVDRAIAAGEDTIVAEHLGSTDPVDEGWTASPPQDGVEAGPIDDRAWFVSDQTAEGGGGYAVNLTTCEAAAAAQFGWTLRTCLRIVDPDAEPSIVVLYDDGVLRYDMWVSADANGHLIVQILEENPDGCGIKGDSFTVVDDRVNCHVPDFHMLEMVFDPISGTATVFVDGVARISGFGGHDNNIVGPRVLWGAGSSCADGYAEIHSIQFEVHGPVPARPDLDCDGVVGTNDLLLLLGQWGPCDDCTDCDADFDDDCNVGTTDLLSLLGSWG